MTDGAAPEVRCSLADFRPNMVDRLRRNPRIRFAFYAGLLVDPALRFGLGMAMLGALASKLLPLWLIAPALLLTGEGVWLLSGRITIAREEARHIHHHLHHEGEP